MKIRAFGPNTAQSAEWNRGAYIAEALAHCGECHTPRNLAFALDNRKKFAGAMTAGEFFPRIVQRRDCAVYGIRRNARRPCAM